MGKNASSPKVSVIVPIYNSEQYLEKCIDSILSQSFIDFELLLIDDGSTDSSRQICDDFFKKDGRIRVFHKNNGGVSSARELGIKNSRGGYSIQFDADDWIEYNCLECLYEKAVADNADMVICDFFIHENGKILISKQSPKSLRSEDIIMEFMGNLHGSLCNKLIRLDCYRKYNIHYPNISYSEDLFICISLCLHSIKISYLAKSFYHYVRHSTSITNTFDVHTGDNAYKTVSEFRKLLIRYPDYWNLYCSTIMPWQAYLCLYYSENISSKLYREQFLELKEVKQVNIRVKLALSCFRIGKLYCSLARTIRKFLQ